MAKDTYKDMTAKGRESVKEVGGTSVTPSTDRFIKNVGLEKAESKKPESSVPKAGAGRKQSRETKEEK